MGRGIAYNRHKETVKKEKVKEYYSRGSTKSPREIGIVARTPALCSCDMCGNPRRHDVYGDPRTLQEIKADLDYEEQLEEYYEDVA